MCTLVRLQSCAQPSSMYAHMPALDVAVMLMYFNKYNRQLVYHVTSILLETVILSVQAESVRHMQTGSRMH